MVVAALASFSSTQANPFVSVSFPVEKPSLNPETLYEEMHLEGVVDYTLFRRGLEGYNELDPSRKEVLTLIDFTKSSGEERFYVLDMKNKKLLFKTYVAHGKNSGKDFATAFSNKYGSYMSSPGFYRTENTYRGRNGYSLVLEGLEKGINDNAKKRAIVVHGSNYVSPAIADARGSVGRSLGCPALPREISRKVIDVIKNGSLLYIHSNKSEYLSKSHIIVNDTVPYASAADSFANNWWMTQVPSFHMV